MNISVTIPQLFYDLIARVLPGFIFLFMLRFELVGTGFSITQIATKEADNSIASLLSGLAYLVLCYFIGWILRAFTIHSLDKKIRNAFEEKRGLKMEKITLFEMYHEIRLQNAEAGFRIVKLRAEARMLESSRTGMAILFIFSISLLLANRLSVISIPEIPPIAWIGKILLPIAFCVAFVISEKPAWNRYYANIVKHYDLLTKLGAKDDPMTKPASAGA